MYANSTSSYLVGPTFGKNTHVLPLCSGEGTGGGKEKETTLSGDQIFGGTGILPTAHE